MYWSWMCANKPLLYDVKVQPSTAATAWPCILRCKPCVSQSFDPARFSCITHGNFWLSLFCSLSGCLDIQYVWMSECLGSYGKFLFVACQHVLHYTDCVPRHKQQMPSKDDVPKRRSCIRSCNTATCRHSAGCYVLVGWGVVSRYDVYSMGFEPLRCFGLATASVMGWVNQQAATALRQQTPQTVFLHCLQQPEIQVLALRSNVLPLLLSD